MTVRFLFSQKQWADGVQMATHTRTSHMAEPLLQVKDLQTKFFTQDGVVHAGNGISYEVNEGGTVAIVGESGSGKSVGVMSLIGLIPQPPGKIVSGEVLFDGQDLKCSG